MTTRAPAVRLAAGAALVLALVAGCGSGGPTAESVVDELGAVFPLPNPRDNTDSCAGDGGCEQLVTADGVSVYQWPDEATAARHAELAGVEHAGAFTMRVQDDYPSSGEARAAWTERFREVAGASAS